MKMNAREGLPARRQDGNQADHLPWPHRRLRRLSVHLVWNTHPRLAGGLAFGQTFITKLAGGHGSLHWLRSRAPLWSRNRVNWQGGMASAVMG
jgi:hypothetical protein